MYDEFNGGVFSPEAIRDFLGYAYGNWEAPASSFVLLVGDGNYDFRNAYGWDEPTYIPPYLVDVDPWVGEVPSDNRYAAVSGSDILPDMYIGRFPVRTPAEAQTMVEKTIDYELLPPGDNYNARQIFLADSGGTFAFRSDQLVNTYVPPWYTVEEIYYGINYGNINTARAALQAAINQGSLILHFVGHGSVQEWGVASLLTVDDLPALNNGARLPFILPWTCLEGYSIVPSAAGDDWSSLGESIVRINGRGAIASWSPSGYGLGGGHDLLDRNLLNDLFNNGQTQLGYLTTQAKYNLFATTSFYNDLIDTYVLFGDPALRLQVVPIQRIYLPLVER